MKHIIRDVSQDSQILDSSKISSPKTKANGQATTRDEKSHSDMFLFDMHIDQKSEHATTPKINEKNNFIKSGNQNKTPKSNDGLIDVYTISKILNE